MQRAHTCLYPKDWPLAEQAALDSQLRRDGLFATGAAADWAPATLDRRVRSYGTFVLFADSLGQLKEGVSLQRERAGLFLRISSRTSRIGWRP